VSVLVLVESGARAYREHLLRTLAHGHEVWLLSAAEPTWERPYLAGHSTVDTTDVGAMTALARPVAPDGVLTWYEGRTVHTAHLARALDRPGPAPEAVLCCRDKHATRRALAAAGVPGAKSVLVASVAEARAAAERIGYPVVLKARALGGSVGVVLVESADQLARRFRIARGATSPDATEVPPGDVLVEEYLPGAEVSVDVAWWGGTPTIAFVARKEIGFPPYFEEVGHLVDGGDPLLADGALRDLLAAAHAAVGFDTGWTHSEVRLTPDGPKVVEINPRLGGDLIPYVAELATGVEAASPAAAVACGRPPRVEPARRQVAGIRFLYPAGDAIVRAVHVDRARLPSTVEDAAPLAVPGQQLRLPPAGHVSGRYAFVTTVAGTAGDCRADLATAAAAVHLEPLHGGTSNAGLG